MIKRVMCLKVATQLLKVKNPQFKERGIIILRSMMSKLKFKYSLKPKWIENLKKIIWKDNIPQIGQMLKNLQGNEDIPIVMRKNPNKLKLANKALDEYLIEDVINDFDLISDVNLLSSDGFLKHSLSSGGESDQNREEDKKQREIEDKKLFQQRLRIEFTTFSIAKENYEVKDRVEELFSGYRKHIIKLFYKYSATKDFDNKKEFENYKPMKDRMNAGEVCKLLRNHTISEYFIIPDEVVHIIREVNSILHTPQDQ